MVKIVESENIKYGDYRTSITIKNNDIIQVKYDSWKADLVKQIINSIPIDLLEGDSVWIHIKSEFKNGKKKIVESENNKVEEFIYK